MSKKRSSAAIIGLLDAIKAEQFESAGDATVLSPQRVSKFQEYPQIEQSMDLKGFKLPNKTEIGYQIKKVPTAFCSAWNMANRIEAHITEDSCSDLIESIKSVGQQIPALVRKIKDSKGYELICGARRLFVCKKLGIDILVAVVDLDDREALLAMDAENRARDDISPYERAIDYKRWIEAGVYKNQAEICNEIGIKKSLFSQLMTLADLDPVIVSAFKNPTQLRLRWGYQLSQMSKNPAQKLKMIKVANELATQRSTPESVYKKLIAVANEESQTKINDYWVTHPISKQKLVRINRSKSSTQLIFNKAVSPDQLERVLEAVIAMITTPEKQKV